MSMQIPRDIYDTWKAVADKFKFLHQGTDDERREATKRGVQTIRARHGEELTARAVIPKAANQASRCWPGKARQTSPPTRPNKTETT